jgi:predicted nuclease with TOPRIM domain
MGNIRIRLFANDCSLRTMSKVQGKDATLLNNLSGSEIANELDSRLRDLEKNIAVAREFIKLADESYSELRHKWNLLHEEVSNKSQTHATGEAIATDEKTARPRNKKQSKTRDTRLTVLDESKSPSSARISPKPETDVKRVKNANRAKKEPEISSDDADSPSLEKPSQPYRDPGRRRGKASGRN